MQTQGRCARWIIRLFGKFAVQLGDETIEALPGRRTAELLGYLLVFRERPHHREVLAGTLWPESDTAQSRKYLRQGLWQLRTLDASAGEAVSLFHLDTDWVEVRCADCWLDVAELEEAFAPVRLMPGEEIGGEHAERLQRIVSLYRGDLLEGCYQDWCVYERERLKAMYIAVLEKLLGYCEAHGLPEEGLAYGQELLRRDPAHERAHWRLMRLLYLAGDRTGALRQFERCRAALYEELGVAPGGRILRLREQIRADRGIDPPPRRPGPFVPPEVDACEAPPLHEALRALSRAERLVRQSIHATLDHEG